MVNFQDSAAFKRLSVATIIVFLLSVGISFGQHGDEHTDDSHSEHVDDTTGGHADEAHPHADGAAEAHGHDDQHHEATEGHHEGEAEGHHEGGHGEGDHAEGEHHEEEEGVGEMILGHIKDNHVWHFWDEGVVYLPMILYTEDGIKTYNSADFYEHHAKVEHDGYIINERGKVEAVGDNAAVIVDFSITKNVASLLISIVVMLIIFFSVGRHYKGGNVNAPKGLAAIFEPIVVFVRDEVAKPNIGPKYEKFVPYLLTLFFFIWLNNLFGLTPGAANLTGNIAVTFTLAILTFIIVNVNGNKNYWRHILAMPGVPKPVLLILTPVEFLSIFTKPFSLMIRLFVAITAGHIVVLSLIGLIFIFKSWAIAPASMILVTFVNMIELLVATIQAYVFTMFTALYIGQAVEEHHDH